MNLTGLEAGLLAANAALLVGALVPTLRGGKYMTRKDCDRRHAACDKACEKRHADEKALRDAERQDIKEALHTLYRMVRTLIIHAPMDAAEKEKALNDRGD